MKPDEIIQELGYGPTNQDRFAQAIEEAIEIINKSIEREPIKSTSRYTGEIVYSCPTCKHTFLTTTWPNYFGINYCGFCGQAIIFKE